MITINRLQEKITERLIDLYEAFYAAQEWIEESEFINKGRHPLQSLKRQTG